MKKPKRPDGLVYSTDPDFRADGEIEDRQTLLPAQQKLRIRLDAKHRAGKTVTLIEGFIGKPDDMEDLGKKLKTFCGAGGAVRDGEIIVQGDHRAKVLQWLLKNGYVKSK